ncbi:MAG: hypothetical protein V3V01_14525 [Acidimicrobiales bacterium]
MADVVLVEALQDLTYRPLDEGLIARLSESISLPAGEARSITGLLVSDSLTRWPIRAFEVWSGQQLATVAVAVLDHEMPTCGFSRPTVHAGVAEAPAPCASDLVISGTDDMFIATLLRPPMSGLIQQLPRGSQLSFAGRFVVLSVEADEPCGLRSLIERCADFVAAIPAAAIGNCPKSTKATTDPLVVLPFSAFGSGASL